MQKDKTPLISVVISAYNKGNFIASTIESVLRQTAGDFEIIVIDDGSVDNTREQTLKIKDGRIKYFYQEPSGLPACARNRGIERARGRYIALLDGDDRWIPEKLEKVLSVFSENPGTDVVCHDLMVTGENAKVIRRTHYGPYPEDLYGKLLWEGNCLGITMAVLKKEIFCTHNFWFDEDERLFCVEDYDFWLRLAETGKFSFFYLPEALAEHPVSEEGIVLSNVKKNTINSLHLFDKNIKRRGYDTDFARRNLIRKRRASMMRSGGLSYNYRREYRKSLIWFAKSIREYPFSKNSYAGFLLSLFRVRLGKV